MKKKNIIDDISIKMMSVKCEADELRIIDKILTLPDINMQGCDGRTLLIHASFYNCMAVIKTLIDNNANLNCRDDCGYTALHAAVTARNINVTEYLLLHGASVDSVDSYGNTPLFRTTHLDIDIIKLLLAHGADPFAKNNYGVSTYDKYLNYPDVLALFGEKKG